MFFLMLFGIGAVLSIIVCVLGTIHNIREKNWFLSFYFSLGALCFVYYLLVLLGVFTVKPWF